ncbi:MAG: 50S ribosomal protein L11 methyltransferase [Bacteroidales bacterium]
MSREPYTRLMLTFPDSEESSGLLVALLSEYGFEGFLEEPGRLEAWIPSGSIDNEEVSRIIQDARTWVDGLEYSTEEVPFRNWNAEWESAYEPVWVNDNILIRAPFHPEDPGALYSIEIQPQMSFGTAHHETTRLMLEYLSETDVKNKRVLDMGCGTGVLAIFCEKKGAGKIAAIDNDPVATDNSLENIARNRCSRISVLTDDAAAIDGEYDVIVANINRNILIADMQQYGKHLADDGLLLLSGFYQSDLKDITKAAAGCGMRLQSHKVLNNWCAALFLKTAKH